MVSWEGAPMQITTILNLNKKKKKEKNESKENKKKIKVCVTVVKNNNGKQFLRTLYFLQ